MANAGVVVVDRCLAIAPSPPAVTWISGLPPSGAAYQAYHPQQSTTHKTHLTSWTGSIGATQQQQRSTNNDQTIISGMVHNICSSHTGLNWCQPSHFCLFPGGMGSHQSYSLVAAFSDKTGPESQDPPLLSLATQRAPPIPLMAPIWSPLACYIDRRAINCSTPIHQLPQLSLATDSRSYQSPASWPATKMVHLDLPQSMTFCT
jgi:hypothetical protein